MRAWHARWQLTQLSRSAAGLRSRVSKGHASALCALAQHQAGTQEPVELCVRPADIRGSKVPLHHAEVHALAAKSLSCTAHVEMLQAKLRLDAYLTEQLPQASRAKLQASIRSGLVLVNGAVQQKTSHSVRPGDAVLCTLVQPQLTSAIPEVSAAWHWSGSMRSCERVHSAMLMPKQCAYAGELLTVICSMCMRPRPLSTAMHAAMQALPLDIVYEDDECLVVNKVIQARPQASLWLWTALACHRITSWPVMSCSLCCW